MARDQYHHGDLAEALLTAAERLIRERGVTGFSLREAARAVGVDPAACYRHYRDKDALLQALGQRGFTRLAVAMTAATAARRSPARRLVALGQAYVGFALEHPALFRTMFGPTGMDARDPRMRGAYGDGLGPYDQLEQAVRAWLAETGSPMALETAVLVMWSGAHGFASLFVDGALRRSAEERERELERMLLALTAAISGRAG